MQLKSILPILLVLVATATATATAAYSATPLSDAELSEITGGGCGAKDCGTNPKCNDGPSAEVSGCAGDCACSTFYGPCPGADQVELMGDGDEEYGNSVPCPKRTKTTYANYCGSVQGQCSGWCVIVNTEEVSCGSYLPAQDC